MLRLLDRARRDDSVVQLDVELAARALHSEAEGPTLLPLHVKLLALSATAGVGMPRSCAMATDEPVDSSAHTRKGFAHSR